MGVQKPSYHIQAAYDLPKLRKKLKGGGGRAMLPELNLTSMIDMFALLIIFLLQSFSANGELFVTNPEVKLPKASFGKLMERAPIITIFTDKVILEGAAVGDNADINEKVEEQDWDLPMLSGKLDEYKRFFESIHTDAKFPGNVIVVANRDLPFVYLKRVMYSLAKVGYTNISLAVRGEATGAVPQAQEAAAAASGTVTQ